MLKKIYSSFLNLLESPMKDEFFESTQKYFRMLGIVLKPSDRKYPFFLRNVRTFCVFGAGTASSFYYTITSAKTFEEFIVSFYVLSSMLICLSLYSFVVWQMNKLTRVFSEINENIQERKFNIQINAHISFIETNYLRWNFYFRPKTFRIEEFVRRNGSTDWIVHWSHSVCFCFRIATDIRSKIHFEHFCVLYHGFGQWCTRVAVSYVVIKHFSVWLIAFFVSKKKAFWMFCFNLCSVPFDWKNLHGYLVVFVWQSVVLWHNFCFTSSLVTLGIGNFLFAITSTKDIKFSLHRLNKRAKRQRYKYDANRRLSEFIKMFPKTKQLSEKKVVNY